MFDCWVKFYRTAPSGAEAVVGVFTKGRSFGEAVAFRHDTYPVSAEAVIFTHVLSIEAAEFLLEMTVCDSGSCTIHLPNNKGFIAGRLSIKPESLSRAFAKLKGHGVKVTQNDATIEDVEKLLSIVVKSDPLSAPNVDPFMLRRPGAA